MDKWEFLRWRRTLGYTQEEAGGRLGVTRGTIQHWERGITRVPLAIELASRELTRRWKQRPEFGPVNLVYADSRVSSRVRSLQCELHSNNDSAFEQVLQLSATPSFINPIIMEDDGYVIWTTVEIWVEWERRRTEQKALSEQPESLVGSGKEHSVPARPKLDDGGAADGDSQ